MTRRTQPSRPARPFSAGPVVACFAVVAAAPLPAQEAPTWAEMGPFFEERCVMCHSGEGAPLGLRLDSHEGAMAGSEDGPVLVAGDPAASELVRRVRGISQPQMPLAGEPLSEAEIGRIEAWVLAGMPAAAGEPASGGAGEGEVGPAAGAAAALPAEGEPATWAHVERVFLQRCVECHSDAREGGPPEGLRLDTLEHVLAGGERLVVVPGNPEASEIVRRIEGTAQPRMPFDGPPWLTDEEIALVRRWIAEGARDEAGEPAAMPVGREVRLRGRMTGEAEIDGVPFRVTGGTRVDDRPGVGAEAELRGVVGPDGGIEATRLRGR